MKMDEQIAFFIAKHIRSNVRELEGALKRVLAYANFHAQDITLPLRDDAVTEGDRHALYQALAPAVAGGLYLVPRVIE